MLEFRPLHDFAGVILANHALGLEHNDEMEQSDTPREYAPDTDRYALMEASGILVAVGAFDGEQLVGYAAAVVATHSHHKDLVMAISDMIFLRKAYRKGRNGPALMLCLRAACKAKGAAELLWTARTGTPFSRLLERMGLKPLETIFSDPL